VTDDKRVAEILQNIRGGQQVHINPSGASLLEAYISGLQTALDATTARLREAEGREKEMAALLGEIAGGAKHLLEYRLKQGRNNPDNQSPGSKTSGYLYAEVADWQLRRIVHRARTFLKGANNG